MMEVVGGTYSEECTEPGDSTAGGYIELIGSGLRAAGMLAASGSSVRFHTCCTAAERSSLESLASTFGFELGQLFLRNDPVRFIYETPVSPPRLRYTGGTISINPVGDSALVFGMVDAVTDSVDVDRLVWDPQQPMGHDLRLPQTTATQIAVVVNDAEVMRIGSGAVAPEEAARAALAKDERIAVVVVKMGALGAFVVQREGEMAIRPSLSTRVWPIGSGDAFAAGFASEWLDNGSDAIDATRAGMGFAHQWCQHRDLGSAAQARHLGETGIDEFERTIYLAAPFFDLGQRWLVNTVREALRTVSPRIRVFSPLHDVGVGGDEVAQADIAGLEESAAVLALLDGDDPGTIFEAGWARKLDIPVVVYGERLNIEGLKMLSGTGCDIVRDLATAVYQAAWHAHGYRT